MESDITKPTRRSGPELLRVVAMLLIVFHHFAVHGGFAFAPDSLSPNRLWLQFIEMGGKVGVNAFILISGYFSVSSRGVRVGKLLRLWLQMFFYSVLLFAIFAIAGKTALSWETVRNALFPVIWEEWWFASAYLVLCLFSPFFNLLARQLSRNAYRCLLGLSLTLWCLIPTFFQMPMQFSALAWFATRYFTAGYFRLHVPTEKIRSSVCLGAACGLAALHYLFVVARDAYVHFHPTSTVFPTEFYAMQTLPTFLISLLLFLGFLTAKIPQNRAINFAASAMFGVYLIHDHPSVRAFLWTDLFRNASYAESPALIPYSLGVCLAVFAVCGAAELLRIYGLEIHYRKAVARFAAFLEAKIPWLANPAGEA